MSRRPARQAASARQSSDRQALPAPEAGLGVLGWCVLLCIVVAAFVARVYALQNAQYWWDEFVTLVRAQLPLGELWQSLSYQAPSDASVDSHPPLLHIVTHLLISAGVHGPQLKIASVVSGAAGVLFAGLLGAALYGRWAGLAAALILALNLFHINYSRELRPYGMFLAFALGSFWCLEKARQTGRGRWWAGYAVLAAGMLYASYLATATLAAQGLYVAVDMAARLRSRPGAAWRFGLGFAAGLAGALALYLPWWPGYDYHLRLIRGLSSGFGVPSLQLSGLAKEYVAYRFEALAWQWTVIWAATGLGIVVAVARNWRGGLMLGGWLAVSLAATTAVGAGANIPARYLFCALGLVAVFGGVLADEIARRTLGWAQAPARVLAVLTVAGFLSLPGILALPPLYHPPMLDSVASAAWLADNKNNVEALVFDRNRAQKVIADWNTQGLYSRLGSAPKGAYVRCFLLTDPVRAPKDHTDATFGDLSISRLGVLRQTPVVLDRPFTENFSTPAFYSQAADWENAGPDMGFRSLTPYDPARPGQASWVFESSADRLPPGLALRCRFRLKAPLGVPAPDAKVSVALGLPGQPPALLRAVTWSDFTLTPGVPTAELTLVFPLPPQLAQEKRLEVAFAMDPGTRHGELELAGFSLDWPQSAPLPSGLAARWATLVRTAPLAPWQPGLTLTGEPVLHAFSLDDSLCAPLLSQGLAPQAAHSAFLAQWPGITPVAVLPGAGGVPAVALYDPALWRPWLEPGQTVRLLPERLGGMKIRGVTRPVALALGQAELKLDAALPPAAEIAVQAAGPSSMVFEVTSPRQALDNALFEQGVLVRDDPVGACLSCQDRKACFVVFAFRLPEPASRFKLVYHPYVYGAEGFTNGVNFALSVDGNIYRPVAGFENRDTRRFTEAGRLEADIVLPSPSRVVYLRLEMSSEESQLRLNPLKPLRLEARLLSPLPLPETVGSAPFTPLPADGGATRLFLSPQAVAR